MLFSVIFNNDKEYIVKAKNILDALLLARDKVSEDVVGVALIENVSYLETEKDDERKV